MVLNKKNFNEFTSNLAIALFLNTQFVRTILQVCIPGFTRHGLRAVFIISVILLVLSIRKIQFRASLFLIPATILVYYIVTELLFPGKTAITLFELVIYSIMPFLFIHLNFDYIKVIKYSLVLTAPAILVLNKVFAHGFNQPITMLMSYSALFSVICALAYLGYYRKTDGKAQRLYIPLAMIQMVYLYELVVYGSRGPLISIIIFLAICYVVRPNTLGRRLHWKKVLMLTLIIVGVLVISQNFTSILNGVYELLSARGIYIRALTKSIVYLEQSDITRGRSEIFSTALKGIWHSPVIGNGLDMFYANTGFVYPHNLFLQLAYDGGFILISIVTVPAVYGSYLVFKMKNYDIFLLWLVLFSVAVVGSLFSGDVWMRYVLWFFVAFCIKRKRVIETRNI